MNTELYRFRFQPVVDPLTIRLGAVMWIEDRISMEKRVFQVVKTQLSESAVHGEIVIFDMMGYSGIETFFVTLVERVPYASYHTCTKVIQ